jgi:peptidoglycan/xylan/chitin deacetylase (PgdA/CDA1 family)
MPMNSNRHLACLSFDFDAVSLWMAMGQKSPTPISRGEFGVIGVERIIKLLDHHNIRGTFFIPGVTVETYPEICKSIAGHGHEIGHHGFTHVSPASMSREEELDTLQRGKEVIKAIAGIAPVGYRSPSWDLSEHSIDLLLQEVFLYDSSMMAHDYLPYYARTGDIVKDDKITFGRESSLLELPVSWSLDDFPHFEYFRGGGLRNADDVMENWLGDFEFMTKDTSWGMLTYTFHPFVIGRGHRMLMLDKFIGKLKDLGAEFVTASDAMIEFKSLY